MFPKYFGVPHAVMRSGLWAKMRPSEWGLYVALMHDSERYRTKEMERTDAQMSKWTGLGKRTLCEARKRLQERGLVWCKRGRGNVYRYLLCDPETGRPWPGDPKHVVYYRKKGDEHQVPPEQKGGSATQLQSCPKPYSSAVSDPPSDSRTLEIYGLPGVFN
jgi:hypothetical protein